jgi:hypothetical protein
VLQQLNLTFDPDLMPEGKLSKILTRKFDRWKAISKAISTAPNLATENAAAG